MSVVEVTSEQPTSTRLEFRELREESLGPIGVVILCLAVAFLLAAATESADRIKAWLLVIPLLLTFGVSRLRGSDATLGSALTIGGMYVSVTVAIILHPGYNLEYAYALVVFGASLLLGLWPSVATAALASFWVVAARGGGPAGEEVVSSMLVVIWAAVALAGLAAHPTRTALEWAWRSYLLAVERSDELRRQRGELRRLAESLTVTCVRLEEMNWELEQARKAAEDARRRKAEFAAMISHELRTPLNLVIGFTEMMIESPQAYGQSLPVPYWEDLEAVYRNACQMSSLVSDVLDLSQIEAHRMALERRATSIPETVEEAVAALAPHLARLGLSLQIDLAPDLPILSVDGSRIRQILLNLLNNAARFTSRGSVTVSASRDEANVFVSVSDTGEGISPEGLAHIFEDYYQVGGSTDHRHGGTGLGLAISRRFAEMHGGYLSVVSTLGVGSTFTLALPLCDNVITSPVSSLPRTGAAAERTVAVLSRDPYVARVFQRYLDGYNVVHALGAGQLSQLAASHPISAVIRTDSDEMTDLSRKMMSLPVFFCPMNTPRALAEALGATDYVLKPFTRQQLTAAIRRCGKRPRDILLVDDDVGLQRLIAGILTTKSRRLRVRQVSDGLTALSELRARPADLVLLDLQIPSLSGYEVLQQMRSDPVLAAIPVVIITGKADPTEAVVTRKIELSRAEGLTVGDMMRCLRGSLDAILDSPSPDTSRVPSLGSGR